MTAPTIAQTLQHAVQTLEKACIPSARLDASVLLAELLQIGRGEMLLQEGKQLSDKDLGAYQAWVGRRAAHEPIAYIIGKKEFWSLDFYVTRDTLIPRPDSETLVQAALKRIKNRASEISILDIGTGTGCLLISLLKELPKAVGVGVDINLDALEVARKNGQLNDVSDRITFRQSHWCDAVNRTFHLIISNPPYIAESEKASLMQDVVNFEPHAALFAGSQGLDAYRALVPQLPRFLEPEGVAVLEVGQHQAEQVMALLREQGLAVERPETDLAGVARCVIARKLPNVN